jgi:predicted PurR-regulated permease PerM
MAAPVECRATDIGSSSPAAVVAAVEGFPQSFRVISTLAVLGALWWAQAVLIPVVLSVLISYALEPFVVRLEAWHVRRAVAALLLMVALSFTLALTAYSLRGEAVDFANRIPVAAHTVSQAIRDGSRGSTGTVARVKKAVQELAAAAGEADKMPNDGAAKVQLEEPAFKWSEWLWQGSRSATELGWQIFAVMCLSYSLLAAGDLYRRKIVRMLPTFSEKRITVQILTEIDRQIERFLIARATISVIVGVAVWMAFRTLGLKEAGVWGVLSAVLFAVPIAGPTALVVAAAVAGFVQSGSINIAALIGGVSAGIGVLEGYVLTPWLMRRVGDMNTVAIFVSLLFWGWIWGIWGLLLAVPITAAIKAVCERMPECSAVAELLKE